MIIFRTYKFRVRNFINTNNMIKLYYYLLSQRSTIPQFQNQNLTCCQLHHETIMKLILAIILYFNYLTIKFIFINLIVQILYLIYFISTYSSKIISLEIISPYLFIAYFEPFGIWHFTIAGLRPQYQQIL